MTSCFDVVDFDGSTGTLQTRARTAYRMVARSVNTGAELNPLTNTGSTLLLTLDSSWTNTTGTTQTLQTMFTIGTTSVTVTSTKRFYVEWRYGTTTNGTTPTASTVLSAHGGGPWLGEPAVGAYVGFSHFMVWTDTEPQRTLINPSSSASDTIANAATIKHRLQAYIIMDKWDPIGPHSSFSDEVENWIRVEQSEILQFAWQGQP